MTQQLKNIFVPYNVAKLAFEKGFIEWCSAIQGKDQSEPEPNVKIVTKEGRRFSLFDYAYLSDDSDGEYGIPTHFQLISWLKDKHDIDVTMQINGLLAVISTHGYTYDSGDNEFEINRALEVGLNLLTDFQHDKQEYV